MFSANRLAAALAAKPCRFVPVELARFKPGLRLPHESDASEVVQVRERTPVHLGGVDHRLALWPAEMPEVGAELLVAIAHARSDR
jgi:hypothetical protein